MKKTLFVFSTIVIGLCIFAGTRQYDANYGHDSKEKEEKIDEFSSEDRERINEMKRLLDSVDKYGFEKGVRRYNLDTLDITDDELDAIKEVAHEISLKYGHLLNNEE